MTSIGAEVGQKMRSAIKAKLMELNCYVDDELPDYIMVMVANRRSKSQMNDDLNLFLSNKTSTFVNWLHIVLKKLKEVTVTNPDVYTKATKRKSSDIQNDEKNSPKIKKEKSSKKIKKESQKGDEKPVINEDIHEKSLTDDLPLITMKFTEKRRIVLTNDNTKNNIVEDNFDIPLLSEVNETANVKELEEIERKINSVKSRLGVLVPSDNEDDWNKLCKEDIALVNSRKISFLVNPDDADKSFNVNNMDEEMNLRKKLLLEKKAHKRITFENDTNDVNSTSKSKGSSEKKASILNRLGKRACSPLGSGEKRKRVSLTEYRRDEEKYTGSRRRRSSSRDQSHKFSGRAEKGRSLSRERSPHKSKGRDLRKESILGRLGVQSKVAVIKKPEVLIKESDTDEEQIVREVPSLIKVKPRVIPSDVPQPNKNLLLKAVAEAQRSIAQTPTVGTNIKPDALFTKKYKEKLEGKDNTNSAPRKIDEKEKSKLKVLIQQSSSRMRSKTQASSDEYDSDGEYIPKPVKSIESDVPKYVPSEDEKQINSEPSEKSKQQFIITLDGIEKTSVSDKKIPAKMRLEGRKTPSPIVFDKKAGDKVIPTRSDIPDKLPVVHTPLSIKNKERCKYSLNCRQGDKCEFVHPTQNCEAFPHCKFGDKCLFLHPKCKFGNSCTKRDCPYDHNKLLLTTKITSVVSPSLQNCKFFPNCTNPSCSFYHPKPCKYGKYCKNIAECNFSHSFLVNKKSLSWRSK